VWLAVLGTTELWNCFCCYKYLRTYICKTVVITRAREIRVFK
jgi:hypothetical protein